MDRPLISYINEYVGVNYSDVLDFFKDLKGNPPEYNANFLAKLLLIIEATEGEDK